MGNHTGKGLEVREDVSSRWFLNPSGDPRTPAVQGGVPESIGVMILATAETKVNEGARVHEGVTFG
jgi:hypothetical protein